MIDRKDDTKMSDIEPGSWERDELGVTFPHEGTAIQYACSITLGYGVFPWGE